MYESVKNGFESGLSIAIATIAIVLAIWLKVDGSDWILMEYQFKNVTVIMCSLFVAAVCLNVPEYAFAFQCGVTEEFIGICRKGLL